MRTLDQDLIWFWLQSLRSNSVSQRWYPSQTDTQAMSGEVQMSVRDGRTDNLSLPWNSSCWNMHTWSGLSVYPSWTDVRDCMCSDRHARGVWIGVRPSRTDMPTGGPHVGRTYTDLVTLGMSVCKDLHTEGRAYAYVLIC